MLPNQTLRTAITLDLFGIYHIGQVMPEPLLAHKEVDQIKVLLKLIAKHISEIDFLEKNIIEMS